MTDSAKNESKETIDNEPLNPSTPSVQLVTLIAVQTKMVARRINRGKGMDSVTEKSGNMISVPTDIANNNAVLTDKIRSRAPLTYSCHGFWARSSKYPKSMAKNMISENKALGRDNCKKIVLDIKNTEIKNNPAPVGLPILAEPCAAKARPLSVGKISVKRV